MSRDHRLFSARHTHHLRPHRDRGLATSVEVVLLVPLLVLVVLVMVAGFRLHQSQSQVQSLAQVVARAAVRERSADQARAVAEQMLRQANTDCAELTWSMDLHGFQAPVGVFAQVQVDLVCRVNLADLGLAPMPTSVVQRAVGIAPLDTYRERSRP